MKARDPFLLGLVALVHLAVVWSVESKAALTCGQTITEDTVLDADLDCPPEIENAVIIGSSNITLDLGGHTISGHTPRTGVLVSGREGVTIHNGVVDGFNVGVSVNESSSVTIRDLTVRNMDIVDPDHFLFGVAVVGSQNVVVRDSLFEFPVVAHKGAVEIFDSHVDVDSIDVRGGGAGVGFSFLNNVCDPVSSPSNGTVRNSTFSDVYVAGIWIACSSSAVIEGNHFTGCPDCILGIQGESPFLGAVPGLIVNKNVIHKTLVGVEFRGVTESTISSNYVFDNRGWGIALRQSLGCLARQPGWDCFYSTANVIADNEAWGNDTDLYHYEESLGNVWERNTCEWKVGSEIPECTPPQATLVVNYPSGKPGSYFTFEGANFPVSSTATITVNDTTLGAVPTDASGDLIFLLSTDQADEGNYFATASVNPSASAGFVLDSSKPILLQEGQGLVFSVPSGLCPRLIYLPLVIR